MSDLGDNGYLYCHVNCGNITEKLCVSCHLPFCSVHKSEFDPTYCSDCVSISNTVIVSKPLTDDEGVTHQGRQLILTGEAWMRSKDVISKMTDVELKGKLEALCQAVHEAEMVLDYRKIQRNQVENELDARLSKRHTRIRLISALDGVHKISNGVTKAQGKPSGAVDNVKDALGALKKLGLNKDAIANVLLKLAQSQKAKENKP